MNQKDRSKLPVARQFVKELHTMHEAPTPATLLHNVLAQIGPGDTYAIVQAPIGPLYVAFNDIGISAIMRVNDMIEFERAFRARFVRPIRRVATPPADIRHALEAEFSGQPQPQLQFDLRTLTPFERAVLEKAREIPRGEVRPYAWIAREIGRPQAVRAVGTALGNNPVPLLIPCHRVLRSDGRIGDYVFGTEAKRAVLNAEGAAPDKLESLARAGVRYLGDPADGSFCLPTCGGMHLRSDRFLKLHSEQEALAAGLAPCRNCRPVAAR